MRCLAPVHPDDVDRYWELQAVFELLRLWYGHANVWPHELVASVFYAHLEAERIPKFRAAMRAAGL